MSTANPTTEVVPFQFQTSEVRTITDEHGEPWFVAADVCAVLGHTNPTVAVDRLDDDERAKKSLGRQGDTWIISESGLYALIVRSNKKQAKVFRKWVTSEVLPTIRKTGKYEVPTEPAITPAQQNQLQQAIAARFPNGKNRPYAWSRFNNHFGLGSYKQLPGSKTEEALAYIATMETAKLDSPEELARLSLYHEAEEAIKRDKWYYAPFQVSGVYMKDLAQKSADMKAKMLAAGMDITKTESRIDLGCFMEMGMYLMHQFPKMAEEYMKVSLENSEAKLLKFQVEKLAEKLVANGN